MHGELVVSAREWPVHSNTSAWTAADRVGVWVGAGRRMGGGGGGEVGWMGGFRPTV